MFSRLYTYIHSEPKGWSIPGTLFRAWLAAAAWLVVAGYVIKMTSMTEPNLNQEGVVDLIHKNPSSMKLFVIIAFTVILEEILFRLVPLRIGAAFLGTKGLIAIAFVSSVVFGWAHVYENLAIGPWLQLAGVGFILSMVYLKCGGLEKKIVKPALCALAVHGFQDIYAIVMILMTHT